MELLHTISQPGGVFVETTNSFDDIYKYYSMVVLLTIQYTLKRGITFFLSTLLFGIGISL